MSRIKIFPLALLMGVACLQPHFAFAQDQDQTKKDAVEGGGSNHGEKTAPKASKQAKRSPQQGAMNGGGSEIKNNGGQAEKNDRKGSFATQNGGVVDQSVQKTNRSKTYQSQSASVSVQGNRSNHYNGQWVEGDTHSDWDRNGIHNWNHHDYRWYDGGWLIVESGGDSSGYYETGAIVVQVKEALAHQGYYEGHFTETYGPHTRRAVSNYQTDKGLPVTGEIDGPLLGSLGLQ